MASKKKTIGRTNKKKLTTNKRVNEQPRVTATYKKFRLTTAAAASCNRLAAKLEKFQQPIKSKEVSGKINTLVFSFNSGRIYFIIVVFSDKLMINILYKTVSNIYI